MKIGFKFMIIAIACSALSACVTPRTYVNPQYHKASYEQIQRPAQPALVRVEVQFQRNGQAYPAADAELREAVEQTLRATGAFIPSSDSSGPAMIYVLANNIADMAAARAKGFGTGLTLGAVGSMVDDNYEFNFSYRDAEGQEQKSTYHHAIHTTIGRATGPAGATPSTPTAAFRKVVEDVTLNFVKDLQSKKPASEQGEADA